MEAWLVPGAVLRATRTADLTVRDIVLVEANCWSVHVENSTRAEVDRVRIIGFHSNPDGICFNGSNQCAARNCFMQSDGDCREVKANGDVVYSGGNRWGLGHATAEVALKRGPDVILVKLSNQDNLRRRIDRVHRPGARDAGFRVFERLDA